MKRRTFLKSVLGITIYPFILKAATKEKDGIVYMGLLYNKKEITGKSYHRIKSTKKWELQTDGAIINIEEMQFPQAKNDWKDINGIAFYNAQKNGTMLISGKLARQVFITSGDTVSFPPRYIKVEV